MESTCPLSFAGDSIKQCITECKFYDEEKENCTLLLALQNYNQQFEPER